MSPCSSIPTLLVFELETKRWSKIDLNWPSSERTYYQLYIDEEATLNVVSYAKLNENLNETIELQSALIRIPFKKPDKLSILSVFQVRKHYPKFKNIECFLPSQ